MPVSECRSRGRIDEQRLERSPLALARGRIHRDLHAAHERRKDHEQRNEIQNLRRALLRARDFDILHLQRRRRSTGSRRGRPAACCRFRRCSVEAARARAALSDATSCASASETILTAAGDDARNFFANSGEITTTTSSPARTACSASAGPATTSTPACWRSQSTRAGACSTPTTGIRTSSSSRCRSAMRFSMKPRRSGRKSAEKSSVSTARRSRNPSRTSLRKTTSVCRTSAASASSLRHAARVVPPRARRRRLRDCRGRSAPAARRACPIAATPPAGDHDDRITQRRNLLHHVTREQHTVAGISQPANDVAHGACAHHVEPVGRLVEQHVLRARARARWQAPPWSAPRARSRRCDGRRLRSCRASRVVDAHGPRARGRTGPATRRSNRCARAGSIADTGPTRRATRQGAPAHLADRSRRRRHPPYPAVRLAASTHRSSAASSFCRRRSVPISRSLCHRWR